VDGDNIMVGGPNMLRELGVDSPDSRHDKFSRWTSRGPGGLQVLRNKEVIGPIAVENRIRPESRAAARARQAAGAMAALTTGDASQAAESVAQELGIDEVFSEVLPQEKDTKVTELQKRGFNVAMVGDGVNDAPALARADIGIAIGAGTDVAMESAGVVLASDDPRAVLSMITLSKASYSKMVQNLVWASGYNILAV